MKHVAGARQCGRARRSTHRPRTKKRSEQCNTFVVRAITAANDHRASSQATSPFDLSGGAIAPTTDLAARNAAPAQSAHRGGGLAHVTALIRWA
jgi:hypothetical protein